MLFAVCFIILTCFINFISYFTMKSKYQKVNLTSDIFKLSKTPQKAYHSKSKSPINKSSTIRTPPPSKRQSQFIDTNDLFQKVCCPNCRYMFKIIKNNQVFTNKKMESAGMQTEPQFSKEDKQFGRTQPRISLSFNVISTKINNQGNFSPSKTSLVKSSMKSSSKEQRDEVNVLQNNTYKLQELSSSIHKYQSKQSKYESNNNQSKSKFVEKLITKNRKNSQVFEKIGKNKDAAAEQKMAKQSREEQHIRYNNYMMELDEKLKEKLKMILMKNYDHELMDIEMHEFLKEIPDSMELAGYQKMLFWDYKYNEVNVSKKQ